MRGRFKLGFSLLELMAVITIIGSLAAIIVARVFDNNETANIAACYVYKGDIEIQSELWMHNTGGWPKDSLADIGAESDYFPEGLPVCPVDETPYTIDSTTGRVVGHNH